MKPLDPTLRPHLAPARVSLAVASAAGIGGGVLLIAQAFAVATLIVRTAQGAPITAAALVVVAVFAARGVLGFVVDLTTARAAGQVTTALRSRVLRASLGSPRRTGELAVLLTRGLAATEPWFTRYLPALVVASAVPLLTVVAIAWLDPWSGLIVALTVPLVPVFAALVGMTTRDRAQRQWRLLQSLSGHFLDVVRGLPTLVAHRRATAQVDTIRAVTHRHRLASLATLRLAFASSVVLELLATLSVALVAVCVGLRLAHGSLDFHTALVVLLLAPEAYWPMRRVGAEFHAAAEGAAAFAAVDLAVASAPFGERIAGAVDGVVLDDVTLDWGGAPVVAGLTARFGIGLTAIVGPSGCGKSTLLAALAGELVPTSGTLRVAGSSVPDEWRSSVAWLPQRPWLSADTIATNLRHGDPSASDAHLWRALERVDLAHVVLTLPLGLETELGEDGAGLSAGERARLALARVLVSERPVVLLDEPTAHLDPATSVVLERVIAELAQARTVIVVAHRPALVDMADHVLTLTALPSPDAVVRPAVAALPPSVEWTPSRRADVGALVLGALSAASGVALTATAGWLITRASDQPPVLTLMVAIVGVRAFGLARPVLRYAERLLSHEQALGRLADRRADVYAALVPLVPARLGLQGRRRGDLLTSLVDDVDALVDERVRVRVPLCTALLVSAGALLFAALLVPSAALVVALPMVATLLVAVPVARRAAGVERSYVDARAHLGELVETTLTDARQLVAWQRDEAAIKAVTTSSSRLARLTRQAALGPASARGLLLVATGAAVAAMPLATSGVPAATAALLVLLPLALHEILAPVIDAVVARARCRAATDRIDALLAQAPAVVDPVQPTRWPAAYPTIEFSRRSKWSPSDEADGRRLRRSLPDESDGRRLRRSLRDRHETPTGDVTFDLAPGDRIGLVGPSGSGKSTIAAQLIRFLDGPVSFDGEPARELALSDIRAHVALVDDDPYLFSTSVAENVRLARPGASDDEVLDALRIAGLGAWVAATGLHTLIGAGHREVSGGERARLGLARAVLGKQPVVVLDEPTAHLDTATAEAVTRDVLRALGGRSIVWITHEEVGLAEMDRVIDLGRLGVS